MAITMIFVLCSFVVGISTNSVIFDGDRPFLGVSISDRAQLRCCYTPEHRKDLIWVKTYRVGNKVLGPFRVNVSKHEATVDRNYGGACGILTISSVQPNDTGMYQCMVNNSQVTIKSHGTYLQVYKPLEKTLNLRESTKHKILTAEGILLLLSVVLPSVNLLCKSKKLHQLEKKKAMKEEENIYQGLNLEDCCTTYDQIERSQAQGPYQDVCNIMEEDEEIQLEKP